MELKARKEEVVIIEDEPPQNMMKRRSRSFGFNTLQDLANQSQTLTPMASPHPFMIPLGTKGFSLFSSFILSTQKHHSVQAETINFAFKKYLEKQNLVEKEEGQDKQEEEKKKETQERQILEFF